MTKHWVIVSSNLTPGQIFAFYYYINSCYYSSDFICTMMTCAGGRFLLPAGHIIGSLISCSYINYSSKTVLSAYFELR